MTSKSIILGVSGGIAAYKAATIASRLFQAGHEVQVLMTPGACEFVQPLTFSAVTRRRAVTDIFPDDSAHAGTALFPHLYPATHADVFCVAPATANVIAKLVQVMADDIVVASALPLPADCRRYFCPAMNADMWNNPVVQDNCRILRERGWTQIGPDKGLLACGDSGYGRMTEPEAIIDQILRDLAQPRLLDGKRILVLSGPTRERIDPVRYISNDSSGLMGKAIAEVASQSGATVEFVTGSVANEVLPHGPRIAIHRVESTLDMLEAAQRLFPDCNAAIFAAAVSDYRPATTLQKKAAKGELSQSLELIENPDIAATLSAAKKKGQSTIGFALQTHDGLEKAKAKRKRKKLDAIVLNGPESFGAEQGSFTLITARKTNDWGAISKTECARRIVDWIANR